MALKSTDTHGLTNLRTSKRRTLQSSNGNVDTIVLLLILLHFQKYPNTPEIHLILSQNFKIP